MSAPPLHAANVACEHPAGWVLGWMGERGVQRLRLYPAESGRPAVHLLHSWRNDARAIALHDALKAAFAGIQTDFATFPLDLTTGTPFQRQVWNAAREVPWGSTETYAGLAQRIGRDARSARAIGTALGANPVHILVPCHRFLGKDGGLVDFAGGLEWKRVLLTAEGSLLG